MTERELKAMYENASLPADRLEELEKRFISQVEAMPQDAPLNVVVDEESEHIELKPAPRRPLSTIFGACGAVAAMVALVTGVSLAYKNGILGTTSSTPDSSVTSQTTLDRPVQTVQTVQTEDESETEDHAETNVKITQDMLPEYPNKGSRHSINVKLDESFAERALSDHESGAVADTEVLALFTVKDCTEATGVEGRDAEFTCYTMTTQTVYYAGFGLDVKQGDEFKVFLYGTSTAQYDGCPPLDAGDRVIAAIKPSDKGYPAPYVLSAEYALADVLTIDGHDYAAVRSSEFPKLTITDFAENAPLERVTTCLTNPARYYSVYDCSDFGAYFYLYMNDVKTALSDPADEFNISMLGFGTDSAGMRIFEQYFCGAWQHDHPWKVFDDMMTLSYTPNALHADTVDYAPDYGYDAALETAYRSYVDMYGTGDYAVLGEGVRCGGFLMDSSAAYMKVTVNGERMIYVIPLDTPETMYCYVTEEDVFRREDFDDRWQLDRRLSTDEPEPGLITRFGLMKLLSDHPAEFSDMVWNTINNGFTDENGTTWSRFSDDGKSEAGFITLISETDDSLTISLPFYSDKAVTISPDNGEPYAAYPSRGFRLAFSGKSCTRTATSGDPEDMSSFYSPLESAEAFPTPRTKVGNFANGSGITVEYYATEPRDGLIDVYAIRNLGYWNTYGSNVCEIYWRNPLTDEYKLLNIAYSPCILISGQTAYIRCVATGFGYNQEDRVAQYRGGEQLDVCQVSDAGFGAELYRSGAYILVHRTLETKTEWLVFTDGALSAGYETYADDELILSEDGFTTTRDGVAVVHDAAGENLEGMLQCLTARSRVYWGTFEVSSPLSTGNNIIQPSDSMREYYEIANPAWRTRSGLLASFEQFLTPEGAQDALEQITDHSVVLIEGQYYSTGGARGGDLTKGRQEYSAELSADGKSAVITYTVYGSEITETTDKVVETYTIGAEKTADGWRLDKFYQPY